MKTASLGGVLSGAVFGITKGAVFGSREATA